MNNIKQILHSRWRGELNMDVTLNGRKASAHKLSGTGTFLVESDCSSVEVISSKEKLTQDEKGNLEGVIYRDGVKYVIRFTPVGR